MTTRAAKLAHTVSVGGTFEDGVIQASEVAGISTVAYTGSYTDLLNKPSLSTVATTGSYTDLSNKPTIPSITGLATTASLATVATTGSYTDLLNKPTTFPTQTGNSGKYLTTDGNAVSWATVNALPTQTGNSGKYLTTNGSAASWTTLNVLNNVPITLNSGSTASISVAQGYFTVLSRDGTTLTNIAVTS